MNVKPGILKDFGGAIAALKAGHRVARAGWNGKGMWLALSCDGSREIPAANFWSPHNRAHAEAHGGKATVLPSITMKTATGEILMGWLASQTDMLAEDWVVLEEVEAVFSGQPYIANSPIGEARVGTLGEVKP